MRTLTSAYMEPINCAVLHLEAVFSASVNPASLGFHCARHMALATWSTSCPANGRPRLTHSSYPSRNGVVGAVIICVVYHIHFHRKTPRNSRRQEVREYPVRLKTTLEKSIVSRSRRLPNIFACYRCDPDLEMRRH